MARNVGAGIESLFHPSIVPEGFRGQVGRRGQDEAEKPFVKTDEYFEEVITRFKGPPGGKESDEIPDLGSLAEIVEFVPCDSK
jgi:hypothetical protein